MSEITLKPVFTTRFWLQEVVPTFQTKDGANSFVIIDSGYSRTLNAEYPFEVEFTHGRDDISTATDGSYSNLNCIVYGRTKSGGKLVYRYSGVIRLQGLVADIVAGKSTDMDYKDGYITNNVHVDVGEDAASEVGWVNRYNLVGRGKFGRENKKLYIDYVVYALE